MIRVLLIFALVATFISCSAQENNNHDGEVVNINSTQLKTLQEEQDVQLIDVRTQREVDEGKIADAVHMDFMQPDFKEQLQKMDKNKPVVVYCAVGGRSSKAAEIMASSGFVKIYNLKGGYNDWVKQK